MPRFSFSRIVIIDSLRASDAQTARQLCDDICSYNVYHGRGLRIDHFRIATSAQLRTRLVEIERDARLSDEYPAIHIECHGSSDASGLVLACGEFVAWSALKAPLTAINVATRCNLVITLASCHGAHLLNIVQPIERAPCASILGPTIEAKEINLLRAYTAFYTTLIATEEGDLAIKALRDADSVDASYAFISAEGFFKNVYTNYLRNSGTLQGYWDRSRRLRRRINLAGRIKAPSTQDILLRFKRRERPYFERCVDRFFMMDLYPENRERFCVHYEDILRNARLRS